jgi:hypothetical protein
MDFSQEFIRTSVIVGLLMGIPPAPGHAFRLEASKAHQKSVANVAAFNEAGSSKAAPRGLLLTNNEVKHIRWCALRYPSYHATDNTILGQLGNRQQCVSPAWNMADIASSDLSS